VEGLEPEQATKDALTYLVMSSDIRCRADFRCSDEVLNKLQEMTQRSDISNFYYFPTDCPHREKNGWTGDINFSAEQLLINFDAANSFKVWLENVRAAQNEEGVIPAFIPTGGWGYYHPPKQMSSGPAWDAACVSVPYYIYKYEGDTQVIEDNVQMIMRLMMYQRSAADENGLQNYGHWDWNHPFRLENSKLIAPLRLTSTIAAYESARRAEYLFGVIGRRAEAQYAGSFAAELREAVRTQLVDWETYTVIGNCQTAQAMAMVCGIFNDDELEYAGKRLVEMIHRDGDVTVCGVIGIRYIFHALSMIHEYDLAYKLITSTERTCYGAWVAKGATTLNEHFPYDDGVDEASQNHHYMGDISSWFIQEIAGIKPNPQVRDISEFEISPAFISALDHAQGYYECAYGRLEVEWSRKEEAIHLHVSVPDGMHGALRLSGGYRVTNTDCSQMRGGTYAFVVTR
jgi:alpha-L-rhamnosidase